MIFISEKKHYFLSWNHTKYARRDVMLLALCTHISQYYFLKNVKGTKLRNLSHKHGLHSGYFNCITDIVVISVVHIMLKKGAYFRIKTNCYVGSI